MQLLFAVAVLAVLLACVVPGNKATDTGSRRRTTLASRNSRRDSTRSSRRTTNSRRASTTEGGHKPSMRARLTTRRPKINANVQISIQVDDSSLIWKGDRKFECTSNEPVEDIFQRVLSHAKRHPTDTVTREILGNCTPLLEAVVRGAGYEENPNELTRPNRFEKKLEFTSKDQTILNHENGTIQFRVETASLSVRIPIVFYEEQDEDVFTCEYLLRLHETMADLLHACISQFSAARRREYVGEYLYQVPSGFRYRLTRTQFYEKALQFLRTKKVFKKSKIIAYEKAKRVQWTIDLTAYLRKAQVEEKCDVQLNSDEMITSIEVIAKPCRVNIGSPPFEYEAWGFFFDDDAWGFAYHDPVCVKNGKSESLTVINKSAGEVDRLVQDCDKITLEIARNMAVPLRSSKEDTIGSKELLKVAIFPTLTVADVVKAASEHYEQRVKRVVLCKFDGRRKITKSVSRPNASVYQHMMEFKPQYLDVYMD